MVITDTVIIKDCPYLHTYSDQGLYICKPEEPAHIYSHKYDTIDVIPDYIETDIPLPVEPLTAEEALEIIMGE